MRADARGLGLRGLCRSSGWCHVGCPCHTIAEPQGRLQDSWYMNRCPAHGSQNPYLPTLGRKVLRRSSVGLAPAADWAGRRATARSPPAGCSGSRRLLVPAASPWAPRNAPQFPATFSGLTTRLLEGTVRDRKIWPEFASDGQVQQGPIGFGVVRHASRAPGATERARLRRLGVRCET